jgi:hypothetical protein
MGLFYVEGIAVKADKSRGIGIGDEDCHAIIAPDELTALDICALSDGHVVLSHDLNDSWQ